jgi:5'-3' exonuclease
MDSGRNINMLVDADSIFFKVAYGANSESDLRKNYDHFCRKMELTVKNKLSNLFDEDETFNTYYAVKGNGNFRKDLYKEYKSHRPSLDQDIKDKLNFLHRYSIDNGAIAADGMEADDLVAIWAYEARENEDQYVICGIDKDLLQIPGNHYNYGKDTWQFIDDDEGHLRLMLQCLTGDNADNIPGLKGIGPKKAEKILQGIPEKRRWNRVKAAWRGHGGSLKQLDVSYQLLKMLTSWKEYDDIRTHLYGEATVSEQHDVSQQVDQAEDLHRLSE